MSDSVCSVFRTWGVLIFMQCICWMKIHFGNLLVTWVVLVWGFGFGVFFFVVLGYFNTSFSPVKKGILCKSASPVNQ